MTEDALTAFGSSNAVGTKKDVEGQLAGGITDAPFVKALQKSNHFAVVRNREQDLYTRAWCLVELVMAKKMNFFNDHVSITGPNTYKDSESRSAQLQASEEDDRLRILDFLGENFKAEEIDEQIIQFRKFDAEFKSTTQEEAQLEASQQAKEEAERRAQDAERRAQDAERKAQEAEGRTQRVERRAQRAAERKVQEEARKHQAQLEEVMRSSNTLHQALEEAERTARREAERRSQEEAAQRAEIEALKQALEAERAAREAQIINPIGGGRSQQPSSRVGTTSQTEQQRRARQATAASSTQASQPRRQTAVPSNASSSSQQLGTLGAGSTFYNPRPRVATSTTDSTMPELSTSAAGPSQRMDPSTRPATAPQQRRTVVSRAAVGAAGQSAAAASSRRQTQHEQPASGTGKRRPPFS